MRSIAGPARRRRRCARPVPVHCAPEQNNTAFDRHRKGSK